MRTSIVTDTISSSKIADGRMRARRLHAFVAIPIPIPIPAPTLLCDQRLVRRAQLAVPLFDLPPLFIVSQIQRRLGLAARLNRAQHARALRDRGHATAGAAIAALLPPPQRDVRRRLGRRCCCRCDCH